LKGFCKRFNCTVINVHQQNADGQTLEFFKGETIEQKVNRIVNNKEPIKDQAPLNYTERKDGINPDYDVRADKWERALETMDAVNKSKLTQRKSIGEVAKDNMKKEEKTETTKDAGGESSQGTEKPS